LNGCRPANMKSHSAFWIRFLVTCHLSLIAYRLFADDCNVKGMEPDAPTLCGHAVQGGFLYGESEWDVKSNLRVGGDDVFVIGLPMDAKEKVTLTFCPKGFWKKCRNFDYAVKQRQYKEQKVKVADKFVTYPPEVEKRIESENAKIKSLRKISDTGFIEFMEWKYPFVKKYPTTGGYGERRVFNGVPKSPHRGMDIAAPKGTPVHPIGRGRVVLTIDSYLAGKMVLVSHGYGIFSAYLHLNTISAKTGDIVDFDSVIGTVGKTGRASGVHLHLGLYHGQTPLDPGLLF